ncbi:MAG: hypothetical protein JWO38_4912 [Gemmataceae bacterium]|nr:hypothetical protein [Gemmataceae bacterium]
MLASDNEAGDRKKQTRDSFRTLRRARSGCRFLLANPHAERARQDDLSLVYSSFCWSLYTYRMPDTRTH